MEIIPAIDIRGGRGVRLAQGDYARETVFGDDPVALAQRWVAQGATRLHVVDLDGAREGRPVNHAIVARIARAAGVPVQVGGGVRTLDDALAYCDAGLARVILGTAAVEDRALVAEAATALGAALVVGIDARDGMVMTRGWLHSGDVSALELGAELARLGVGRFVYTDIARDGMLQGMNAAALVEFQRAVGGAVIASGGISAVADVEAAARAGAEGAIIGAALYAGKLTLADAQRAALVASHAGPA